LVEHPNVLNRFFALERFQGCFRLEFLVIPCAQGESYASLLNFCKKGFNPPYFAENVAQFFGLIIVAAFSA